MIQHAAQQVALAAACIGLVVFVALALRYGVRFLDGPPEGDGDSILAAERAVVTSARAYAKRTATDTRTDLLKAVAWLDAAERAPLPDRTFRVAEIRAGVVPPNPPTSGPTAPRK